MRRKDYLIISILVFLLSGCDDKHINHGYRYGTDVTVDWTGTEKIDDDNVGSVIIITDGNGNQVIVPGGNGVDNVPIELDDGKYTVVVGDDVDNITYNNNQIIVDTDKDGFVSEPPFFSAGETSVTIDKGNITEGEELIMYRQTRELIVRIRVLSGLKHFQDIQSFYGVFDGVTISRDLLYGFPPVENPTRPFSEPTYGILNMEFDYMDASSDSNAKLIYQTRYRLLGIGADNSKTITFSYKPEDVQGDESAVFYVLDVTDMITDFHTLKEVENPYVLIIDLVEDPSTGKFLISDWEVGDITDLIAGEQ